MYIWASIRASIRDPDSLIPRPMQVAALPSNTPHSCTRAEHWLSRNLKKASVNDVTAIITAPQIAADISEGLTLLRGKIHWQLRIQVTVVDEAKVVMKGAGPVSLNTLQSILVSCTLDTTNLAAALSNTRILLWNVGLCNRKNIHQNFEVSRQERCEMMKVIFWELVAKVKYQRGSSKPTEFLCKLDVSTLKQCMRDNMPSTHAYPKVS